MVDIMGHETVNYDQKGYVVLAEGFNRSAYEEVNRSYLQGILKYQYPGSSPSRLGEKSLHTGDLTHLLPAVVSPVES